MTVNEIIAIMALAERGAMTVQTILAMREAGISDEQILSTVERVRVRQERLKSLDLREPKEG